MKSVGKVILWIIGILTAVYLCGVIIFNHVFPFNTYLNQVSIFFSSPKDLTIRMLNHTANRELSFIAYDDSVYKIKFADAGIYKDSDNTFANVELNGWEWPLSWQNRVDYQTYSDLFYIEDDLYKVLSEQDFVHNYIPATDAYLKHEGNRYELVYEDDGTEIDLDKLFEYVCECLDQNIVEIRIDDANCYKHSVLQMSDSDMECESVDINALRHQSLRIEGESFPTFEMNAELIDSLFYEYDGKVFLKTEFVKRYMDDINLSQYNTYQPFAVFTTSMNTEIRLNADYGYEVDADETFYSVCKALCNVKDDVVPIVWKHKGCYFDNDSVLGDTYIELDITSQTMWFYKDGKKIVKTPVVTGLPTKERETPTGIFKIRRICTNYTMTGETWSLPCKYFLQVTSDGVGIHDASWREEFGKQIYKTDGSHGCINTPEKAMEKIYKNVVSLKNPRITVIIYNS